VGAVAAAPPVHFRHLTPTAVWTTQSTHSGDPHTPQVATRSLRRWLAQVVTAEGPDLEPVGADATETSSIRR
jgi:hypothetical protein